MKSLQWPAQRANQRGSLEETGAGRGIQGLVPGRRYAPCAQEMGGSCPGYSGREDPPGGEQGQSRTPDPHGYQGLKGSGTENAVAQGGETSGMRSDGVQRSDLTRTGFTIAGNKIDSPSYIIKLLI